MFKKGLFTVLLFASTIAFSQNLVPDPSFETDTACPFTWNVEYNAFWTNPTAGTPDYFDTCSNASSGNDVPNNYVGSQNAYAGGAYVGMITKIAGDFKEYVQVRLIDSLQAGVSYCVTYYISLAGKSGYATNAPQMYFSDSTISSTSSTYFTYVPQINNPAIISDTTNWVLVSGSYTATGGEKYITIGNFYSDANTPSLQINFNSIMSFYYIDNVSVVDCDSSSAVNELGGSEIALFPNPSNGQFSISLGAKNFTVNIFDALGKLLYSESNKTNINISSLAMGIYFLKVTAEDKSYSQKIVIQ